MQDVSQEAELLRDLPQALDRCVTGRIRAAGQDLSTSNTFSSIRGVAVLVFFFKGYSVPAVTARAPRSTQFSCMNRINYSAIK